MSTEADEPDDDTKPFNPDWSMLDATRASLREHMALLKTAHEALRKISAIRDSIVGTQSFNWSEHAYPLVAALEEAGWKGDGHEIASANLGTLIERTVQAESERNHARAIAFEDAAQWHDHHARKAKRKADSQTAAGLPLVGATAREVLIAVCETHEYSASQIRAELAKAPPGTKVFCELKKDE